MKHFTLLACLSFFTTVLTAQDLHIYYNTQNETLRYEVEGKAISRPKVRRGSTIFLHVENFNNYIYKANVEAENQMIAPPPAASPSNLTNLFPTLSGGGGNLLGGLTGGRGLGEGLTFAGAESAGGRGPTSFSSNLGISRTAFNQLTDMVNRFSVGFEKIRAIDTTIQAKQRAAQSILEAHQIRAIVLQEVEAVRYDPNLTPDQIKKLSRDYLEKVLDATSPSDINLNTLLQKGNTRAQLDQKLTEIKSEHDQYNQTKNSLFRIKDSLQVYDTQPALSSFTAPVMQAFLQADNTEKSYAKVEQDLSTIIATMPAETDVLRLTALWRTYEEIATNTFSRTYRTVAKGDQISLMVKMNPTEAALARTAVTPQQFTAIDVPIFGGLKINASIGVAFGQLFSQPQSCFLRDSSIRAEDKDSFFPIVTSFFHFYGQTAGNTAFGGSFGIGLPIVSSDGVQSASFFLGPSLIIGRGERIVLTSGIMGSRVNRLAQGYEVGDTFISQANNVPTKTVYELGYFLGLSFNVLGGGSR